MLTFSAYSRTDEVWYEYIMMISKKLVSNTAEPEPEKPDAGEGEMPEDGDYTTEVESSSSMFKVVSCILNVKDGKITAQIALSGTGYDKLFVGTAADAANASESDMIGYTVNADGKYVFIMPVSALDTPIAVAAHSLKYDKWYDRDLTFKSEGLQKVQPDLEDGEYTTSVETGAAMFKVVSCIIAVKDGKYVAKVALSGTGYDKLYMGSAADAANASESDLIGYAVNADGKYEFVMPVFALDTPIAVASHAIKSNRWFDRTMTFSSKDMNKVSASLADGSYNAFVETGAAMFKVIACVLHVKDGTYTADITLSGTGYDRLCMGSAENAARAAEHEMIGYTENTDGKYVFTIPVSALDTPIALASHSLKKDVWYDRTITIRSESLQKLEGGENPGGDEDGDNDEAPAEPENKPVPDLSGSTSRVNSSTSLADGIYKPDKFSWSGGSGRVSISCKQVTVENGKAYATIVFSSPHYSYVKANGQKIYGSHSGGTSSFKVPVELNANNRILGMTTKMTANYEIAYTIYIYIAGAKDFGDISEDAKEAEIIGLNYTSTVEFENSTLLKSYRYDGGFIAIDVANVGRYLLIPKDAEVPVGLEEDARLIQMPVQSVCAADDFVLEMIEGLRNEELYKLITSVGTEVSEITFVARGLNDGTIVYAGDSSAPNYAALLKTSCDIVILPKVFAVGEDTKIDEATVAVIADVYERFGLLGIPVFVDRSADEATEAGRLEWIKVYGMILGCEEEALALYEKLVAELSTKEIAA